MVASTLPLHAHCRKYSPSPRSLSQGQPLSVLIVPRTAQYDHDHTLRSLPLSICSPVDGTVAQYDHRSANLLSICWPIYVTFSPYDHTSAHLLSICWPLDGTVAQYNHTSAHPLSIWVLRIAYCVLRIATFAMRDTFTAIPRNTHTLQTEDRFVVYALACSYERLKRTQRPLRQAQGDA